jgi:hypothetical protein
LEAVAAMPEVKAILPSEIPDILPKPVKPEKASLKRASRPPTKQRDR